MAFDFAQARFNARKAIHNTLSTVALYSDAAQSNVEILARWTQKQQLTGDLDNDGYSQSIESIDRVIFSATDVQTIGVKRGGTITFPAYQNIAFTLHEPLPSNGPFSETWLVARV